MGPRSIDRGIPIGPRIVLATSGLQWGRDQLIAEFTGSEYEQLKQAELQWGRDQLIAEFAPATVQPAPCESFNGAAIN